jgi:hypothetical protein
VETIEQTEAPKSPAKRKRKKAKTKRAAPVKKVVQIPAVKEDALLGGLSATECPYDCGPNCTITGSICAHPNKGGLQSAFQNNPDVIVRYNKARKLLAHQALDKKP